MNAVVTGASSGIGSCSRCASRARARAWRWWRAARPSSQALAAEIRAQRRRGTRAAVRRRRPRAGVRGGRTGRRRRSGRSTCWSTTPATAITAVPRLGSRRHGAHDARQLLRHPLLDQGAAAGDGRAAARLARVHGVGRRQDRRPGRDRPTRPRSSRRSGSRRRCRSRSRMPACTCSPSARARFAPRSSTQEALARMPPVAKRGMVEPEGLVDAIIERARRRQARDHLSARDRGGLRHQGGRARADAPRHQADDAGRHAGK